jgi:sugar lactone lactonase YvrE
MANTVTGESTGAMYRLETDLSVTRLASGIGIFNGPCFSPDGRRFYYADSGRHTIWACDYAADGTIANRVALIDTQPLGSLPDGATVDAAGNIWVALVSAGAIACFSPHGRLLRRIATPVRFPSSVNFGGPQLDVLYITSISKSLRFDAPEPEAGGVFAVHGLGVRGLAEPRFAG